MVGSEASLDEDGLLCSSPSRKRRPPEQASSVASPQLPTTTPELPRPDLPPRSDLPVIPGRPNLFPEPTPIVPVVVSDWVASTALVQNPAAIDNPLTVAAAAAEMKRFNATWHATSLDPDSVIVECRAAMSNMFSACSAMVSNELAPIRPEIPANLALRPNFSALTAGTRGNPKPPFLSDQHRKWSTVVLAGESVTFALLRPLSARQR